MSQPSGQTPRIVLASLLAFWAGEFVNSFVLAKMKIWTNGRYLWSRTFGSTFAGEAVDSLIFYPLAFYGVWSTRLVISVMIANYLLKSGWEVVNTPITYKVVKLPEAGRKRRLLRSRHRFHAFSLDA